MSGVIDRDGQQWEHCMSCRGWVRIQALLYEEKSEEFPYGRDLCGSCWRDLESGDLVAIKNRLSVELAREAREKARFERTVYPTVCGHGATPSQRVCRFVEEDDSNQRIQSYRGYDFCSEACAEAWEKEQVKD